MLSLDLSLWHKQLGHHNYLDICKMISDVDGLVLDSKAEPDPICKPCLAGKIHANLYQSIMLQKCWNEFILMCIRSESLPMVVINTGCHLSMIVHPSKCCIQ